VAALAAQIEATPGVELVTRFGNAMHVSGRDAIALEAAVKRFGAQADWQPLATTLEDVFIFLMRGAEEERAAS
jgi:ABC-2 type transport system ATP-binding protein